ncbi:MFS transporter [Rosenbergiella australiborealis]|uniref:MFS transporter n=1 Tax=Rosenbergiella australiborealis TaxID=1544696 RepID=A0ABS5T6X7_9GAMM|nr:MFS transporter [Rosenbergiella australiborealis]MBT0728092.1 MFS transporter [Rosenbergiella australiborealis]
MTIPLRAITLSRSTLVLLLLGFSSGLPLALTSGTLQAWMTVENVDLKTIGFFSLVGQAYVFKFLWAPMMDRYSLPFSGRRRGWLLVCQIILVLLIAAMGTINPTTGLFALALLAVAIAFCSASQDIVFDAWKTDVLSAEERGKGAALTVLGYRIAMLVSGGVALWLADRYLGWHNTYYLMAGLMCLGLLGTLLAKEPVQPVTPPLSLHQAIRDPLKDFFNRNNTWLMITLIIFYKLGDAFAGALSTSFLIRGLGFSAADVGLVNKSLGLIATIIGALYGGALMRKWSLYRALMVFGIAQAVSNLAYWLLTVMPSHLWSMGSAVFIENLCGGMGTAAAVALLMSLCHRRYSATQFALLSALSAMGRVYVGPVAGWLVEMWHWSGFYAFTILASLPGLLLLRAAKSSLQHVDDSADFIPRSRYPLYYSLTTKGFFVGTLLAIAGLLIMLFTYLLHLPDLPMAQWLVSGGMIVAVVTTLIGVVLDILSREKHA